MDRGQGAQEQQGNRRVEPEDLRAPRQVQATTVATSANERRPDVEGAPWQQAQGQHGLARQPQECQALNNNNTLTYRFEKKTKPSNKKTRYKKKKTHKKKKPLKKKKKKKKKS